MLGILLVLVAILLVVFYRYGVFDNYAKQQFVAKMQRIGIVFSADTFRVTIAPLQLELKNATFNDKITGEKLFFIREAEIGLTVKNLYAWQLCAILRLIRPISTARKFGSDSTKTANPTFQTCNLSKNKTALISIIRQLNSISKMGMHYGDVERKLGGDAKNVLFGDRARKL